MSAIYYSEEETRVKLIDPERNTECLFNNREVTWRL